MSRTHNGVTYDLGHNEQMQLGIAVSLAAGILRGDPPIDPADLEDLDLDTLAMFEGIFNLPHGTVSVTRRDEAEKPERIRHMYDYRNNDGQTALCHSLLTGGAVVRQVITNVNCPTCLDLYARDSHRLASEVR